MKKISLLSVLLLFGCQAVEEEKITAYENATDKAIYQEAKKLEQEGDAKQASIAYSALRAYHPESQLVQKSLNDSLILHVNHHESEEAIEVATRIIDWYPVGKLAEKAYYYRAKSRLAMHRSWAQKKLNIDPADISRQRLEDARADLNHILLEYPQGLYLTKAKFEIKKINRLLARHQIHIAKFYAKSGNYKAAISRAQDAIKIDPSIKNIANTLIKSYKHV